MVTLNVLDLLEKQGKSKYWLYNQLEINNYTNFNNLINNKTKYIKYEYIEKLCTIFDCQPNDLFTIKNQISNTNRM